MPQCNNPRCEEVIPVNHGFCSVDCQSRVVWACLRRDFENLGVSFTPYQEAHPSPVGRPKAERRHKYQIPSIPPPKLIMTGRELAEFIGAYSSVPFLKLFQEGKLPGRRVHKRRIEFPVEDTLKALVKQGIAEWT